MTAGRLIDVTPDPVGLIRAMGSSGYKYDKIASEFVDNSIDAGADDIRIMIAKDLGTKNHITFADNGTGILPRDRETVLRPGTQTKKKSLSAFGMGMKTAAFSMGRVLRVMTKCADDRVPTVIKFDQNEIAKSGKWEARIWVATAAEAAYFKDTVGEHGTAVTVSDLTMGKLDLQEFEREIKKHLGLTYGLIMLGISTRYAKRPFITVNDTAIQGIDPLFRHEAKLKKGEPVQILMDTGNVSIPFEDRKKAEALITIANLPHEDVLEQEDPARLDRHAIFASTSYRRMSGFYLYREDRLIQYGLAFGYCRDSKVDSMRGELRFFKDSDNSILDNYTKSSVKFPDCAREYLDKLLLPYCKTARDNRERVSINKLPASEEAKKMASVVSKVIDSKLKKHMPLPPLGKHSKRFEEHFRVNRKKTNGKFGRIVYNKPTKSDIVIEKTLPGRSLFEGFVQSGRVGVRIAEDHPYFQMFKQIEKKSPDAWAHFLFIMHAIVYAQMVSGDGFEEVYDRVNAEVSVLLRKYAEKWSK